MSQDPARAAAESQLAQTLSGVPAEALASLYYQLTDDLEKLKQLSADQTARIQDLDDQIVQLVQQVQERDTRLGEAVGQIQEREVRIQQLEAEVANCRVMQQISARVPTAEDEVMVRPRNAREALASLSHVLAPSRTF